MGLMRNPFADREAIGIAIEDPTWQAVARFTTGTPLSKRRTGGTQEALLSARSISARFGCYSWATAREILYCGSYSRDYKTSACRSNLEGRLYQYFANHKRAPDNSPKNTNARVHDRLVETLTSVDAIFQVLVFDRLSLDGKEIEFSRCSSDPFLVRAIERLLICSYKQRGQCRWNEG